MYVKPYEFSYLYTFFAYICICAYVAHSQLHYVQFGILNIVPGCGHQRGIYNACAHNATTCVHESISAGNIRLNKSHA